MTAAGRLSAAMSWLARTFRRHLAAFLLGNALLTAANVATGGPWWAYWPFIVWTIALAGHYLVYKTATIDKRWVDTRADELKYKSYDRGHIDSISSRYETDRSSRQ
ncbi:MAG: 2TM domain-containing protein [Methyloligellaceae bacterium]